MKSFFSQNGKFGWTQDHEIAIPDGDLKYNSIRHLFFCYQTSSRISKQVLTVYQTFSRGYFSATRHLAEKFYWTYSRNILLDVQQEQKIWRNLSGSTGSLLFHKLGNFKQKEFFHTIFYFVTLGLSGLDFKEILTFSKEILWGLGELVHV